MKKLLFSLSLVINVLFAVYAVIITYGLSKPNVATQENAYRVAILTPVTHPALEQIEQGFKDYLIAQKVNVSFTTYNANGNQALMRAQVEEILQKKYDLICTVATHATKLMKEVSTKKHITIPIVFAAVNDPVNLGLVADMISSGNHLTGTTEENNYEQQIALLAQMKPGIKNVLLVYDPVQRGGLEKDKQVVERLLQARGISVQSLEIFNSNELSQKVPSVLQGIDTVMIFKDNTVVPAVDVLIKLCERAGISLFVSDLESVDKGAVMGYGVHEKSFGTHAGKLAEQILVHHIQPSALPIVAVADHHLKINRASLDKQHVAIEPMLLELLKVIEVK